MYLHFNFIGSRKRWSIIQKRLMKKYFKNAIETKRALRKAECETFIDAYKRDFDGVSWVRVKSFIFNEGRCKSNVIS